MEIIVETLAAGQTKNFRKAGAYVEIIDSSYAIGMNFYSVLGGQINSIKGGLSGLYLRADFGALDVVNGANAQTVTILLCDAGEDGGSRRQPGIVSVVDGNRSDVQAGKAFVLTSSYGGTAATFAGIGLWNPAGTGKNAVVTEISVSAGAATSVQLGLTNVVPTTLDSATSNKLLGGASADPVRRAYQEYGATNPAGFTRLYTWLGIAAANKVFARPIIVPQGYGLVAINQTAAQQLSVNLEWTNETV